MQPVSYFREQHVEILKMVEELRPLLNKEQLHVRLVAKTAQKLLAELAERMKGHLGEEEWHWDNDVHSVRTTFFDIHDEAAGACHDADEQQGQ